jgi:hypothetical protein
VLAQKRAYLFLCQIFWQHRLASVSRHFQDARSYATTLKCSQRRDTGEKAGKYRLETLRITALFDVSARVDERDSV